MLSKLFRSRARFDDPDAENRRRAVVALPEADAAAFQDDLAELARTDPDRAVRRAALARVTDVATLEHFVGSQDDELSRLAAEGVAALGHDPARFNRPEIRNAAIRAARDPDAVLGLIGDVGYDREIIVLAVEARHPRVRLALAEKLVKESSLIDLERMSRDRDKNVNRLARSRLDAIKHARADHEKATRRADELVRTLAVQVKAGERDPLFAAKLGVMRQDWIANAERHAHAVEALARHGVAVGDIATLAAEFAHALGQADAITAARSAAAPRPSETPEPPASPAPASESGTLAFADALRSLDALVASIRRGERDAIADYDAVHRDSIAAQDRWLATADHEPPPDPLAAHFHAVTHELKLVFEAVARAQALRAEIDASVVAIPEQVDAHAPEEYDALWNLQRQSRGRAERVERLLGRIDWPRDAKLPGTLAGLEGSASALAALDGRIHALHDDLVNRLKALLKQLETEIEAGNLHAAAALESEGRRLLKCLPIGTAKRLQGEFNHLAVRVIEFKDWVTYATHPKREEFLTEMEGLAAAPRDPPEQAERIKALREQWKSLGPITSQADRRLFERFNAAAEQAFVPCRAFFEEQSQRRRFNLEQRTKICEDLTLYLEKSDWSHPDWRAAERILQVARDEWRKFHPVDRSPGRKLDQRFEELTSRLHAHIKGEWDRNIAQKQQVVTEAAAVRDAGGDLRPATEQIKALQRRWREIGITPRRVDQRLWRDFRAICDEVFGRRDVVRAERREVIGTHVSEAEHVLDEYQQTLEAAHEHGADAGVAREFAERLHAIQDLPREAARRVENRFREIDKNYRVLLRQTERKKLTSGVDRLESIDAALTALELDLKDGVVDAVQAADRLAGIAGLDLAAPGPFAERIERLRAGDAGAADAASERVEARRRLAVEMEIVAGLDTPPEDQRQRLALQVERLNQKHRQSLDDDPLKLAERWCRLGPVAQDDAERRERFFVACREALH